MRNIAALAAALAFASPPVKAADCVNSTLMTPAPFMGNHGEIFSLADGSVWQVIAAYNYMYAYYPSVMICPALRIVVIDGKKLPVLPIGTVGK